MFFGGTHRSQNTVLGLLELELQVFVGHLPWVMGSKPESSGKVQVFSTTGSCIQPSTSHPTDHRTHSFQPSTSHPTDHRIHSFQPSTSHSSDHRTHSWCCCRCLPSSHVIDGQLTTCSDNYAAKGAILHTAISARFNCVQTGSGLDVEPKESLAFFGRLQSSFQGVRNAALCLAFCNLVNGTHSHSFPCSSQV